MAFLMFKVLILFVLNCCINGYIERIAVRLPLPGFKASPGAPWPKPQVWQNSTQVKTMRPSDFEFETDLDGCDILTEAFYRNRRYLDLGGEHDDSAPELTKLRVNVKDEARCDAGYYPEDSMNEQYSLTIDGGEEARLESDTVWGALRGIETFTQLLYLSEDGKYYINETSIEDYPRYNYRGIMLDTARHFMPVSLIMQTLDAMSWNKFNVLHWHVVDDQSFPYPSKTFPNLTTLGAWSPDHQYSQDDVRDIIETARMRGIRVIPEFDTPGHTWSWGWALKDLITPCWGDGVEGGPHVPNYPEHGEQEVVNPMNEYTYDVMSQIWEEIVEDFPDEYVHIGVDEAYYACWKTNPNITDWMETMNFTEYSEVEAYYVERLIDIVTGHGAKIYMWQDPIDNNATIPNNAVIMVWKDDYMGQPGEYKSWEEYMRTVVSQNFSTILAAPWYLNIISYGQDWRTYYEIEPSSFSNDTADQDKVLGGEATMWAEFIDGTNFHSRLWPRASAVAERLWSSKDEMDVDSAAFRLDQQRCRSLRRGIQSAPILPGFCGDYEWELPDWNPDATASPTQTPTPGTTVGGARGLQCLTCLIVLLFPILKWLA